MREKPNKKKSQMREGEKMINTQHVSVMRDECIDLLSPAILSHANPVVIDATLGLGGHTESLLSKFPHVVVIGIDLDKQAIEADIQADFDAALDGIKALPLPCRFGVYVAFKYYYALFNKIKQTNHGALLSTRIRIPDYGKLFIVFKAKIRASLNLL
jgi:tRNA G46 methylase TrmB